MATLKFVQTVTKNRLFGLKPIQLSSIRHASNQKTIGFVGLGNMGGPMTNNLLKKQHKLVVYDIAEQAMADCKKNGAETAKSPAEVASRSDIVITMLPTNQHVLDCYLEKNGVLEGAKSGSIFVDSSTIDPNVAVTVEKAAAAKQIPFLDAPVSGGVIGARDGTLAFMVGGEEKVFNIVKPILQGMGKNIFHCGKTGCGQAAKICNNMLLAITMLGLSEAMNLGIKLGLDPKLLTNIINTSTGHCWSSEKYNPVPGILENVPSSRQYEGGFMSKLTCKDLGLAQDIATRLQCPIPLGSQTHQFYRLLLAHGEGDRDFSYVFQFLQNQ